MKKHTFYHDGCEICALAGKEIVNLIGLSQLDIVHVGLDSSRLEEAKTAGVRAFPALVTGYGSILHLNVEEHEGTPDCLF